MKREELLSILGIRFAGVCSKKEAKAYEQIEALIKKPPVTEEWVEEKMMKLFARLLNINGAFMQAVGMRNAIKDFIRSLVEEIRK